MKSADAVIALAALAQASRLALYRLLVQAGPEGVSPGTLSERLDIPAPTLSFHLKALNHAGLVDDRREGRNLFYTANYAQMNALVDFLTDNCCGGRGCKPLAAPARRRKAS
jgi:ArsR family transcriptional regulator, arsenate/arsenite/antimonite-responsive transcriptional repressor